MRIALFTHHFLEPTHHAIAQVLGRMSDCEITVFAKRFENHFDLPNIRARISYIKGPLPDLLSSKFDLVHAIYDGKTAFRAFDAASRANIPFVLSFHGGFDIHAKIFDPRYTERSRVVTSQAAAVTVVCQGHVKMLRRIGVGRAVSILPVPVVLDGHVRRNRDPKRLALVGRFVPKKGVDLALRALKLLPGYSLDLVGDGELMQPLKALASELEVERRVIFHGLLPYDSMLEVLGGAFALLHPARVASDGNAEGTPQAVLLAQALAVPVVAADSGSLSEIIEHEKTGLMVPPENPEALASAVRRLVSEPLLRQRLEQPADLTHRALTRVEEALRAVYAEAIGGPP